MKKLARGQAQRLTQSYHANHTRLTLHLPLIKKKKTKQKKQKTIQTTSHLLHLRKCVHQLLNPQIPGLHMHQLTKSMH